jgi:hypothetical protein
MESVEKAAANNPMARAEGSKSSDLRGSGAKLSGDTSGAISRFAEAGIREQQWKSIKGARTNCRLEDLREGRLQHKCTEEVIRWDPKMAGRW